MSNQQDIELKRIARPRKTLRPVRRNDPDYECMVMSVRKDGVLQPILIRPDYCIGCKAETCEGPACQRRAVEHDYENVEGCHRYEAAKENGLDTIPAHIREMTDQEVLVVQIKCNAIRPKTHTFEYARRLKMLMENGATLPQLSVMVDKPQKWIQDQLQLNRICPEARPAFERGEIKMTAGLALANLPTDLQPKFLDDAIALPATEFRERASAANRDFKSFLLQLQQEDREIGAATPKLRAINVLKKESLKPSNAKGVLKAVGAKTPQDGWLACLQWMFRLDPISVEKRKAGREETENARLSQSEFHRTNREMIEKFVNPESPTGDHRNG